MPSTAESGFMGSIYRANDWLKTRINNIDIFDEHYVREAKTNPFYALGPIFYLVWFIVMATGLVLIMWYIPTKAAAFDSILRIQHHIPLGGLIRGVHKYGADAMIIAATLRMFRMFLAADYKPAREFNIAIALITLLLSMYSGLTGYLLIWNQRAFWATKVFATFPTYMDQFPVMGDFYLPLVKSLHMGWNTAEFLLGAGGAITQETITRFFSLHLAFSLIPLIFVELYFYRTGYTRISLNWIKRWVIVLMLIAVAIILPAAIGARSNPDVTPLPILSDWYFLGLYQMYKYLEPVVATEITMVIPLFVIILPFLDVAITGPEKSIWKRPFIFMTTMMGLINWIVFSLLIIANIANIHSDPPPWRCFMYLMVNVGMVWQLALIWNEKDPLTKFKSAGGCIVMGVLALIQAALGFVYYFMAKADMFLSPLTQAWAYMFARPFMGAAAEQGETLVRTVTKTPSPPDYWNWAVVLKEGTPAANAEIYQQAAQISAQTTPLDFIFQMIPTFIPGIQYQGTVDFMLSNRWMSDYVTFVDKMSGNVEGFPMHVPELDWVWMIAGAVVAVLCFWTYTIAKKAKPPAKPAAPAKQPAAVS